MQAFQKNKVWCPWIPHTCNYSLTCLSFTDKEGISSNSKKHFCIQTLKRTSKHTTVTEVSPTNVKVAKDPGTTACSTMLEKLQSHFPTNGNSCLSEGLTQVIHHYTHTENTEHWIIFIQSDDFKFFLRCLKLSYHLMKKEAGP